MSKRTKLILVIVIGLLLLMLGVWFLLQPLLKKAPVTQPAALPSKTTPYVPPGKPTPIGVVSSTLPVITPPTDVQLGILENQARITVERIGSGVSDDGFVQYQDVLSSFTSSGQTKILTQQKTLQQQHPASGPAYGMTTRAISSHVTSGKTGDAAITANVEAIQYVDNGNPAKPLQNLPKLVVVTFEKQSNGSYLISDMVWTDEKI